MNEVIRQLIARKSVRAYTDRDITDGEKRAILTCAANAPTAGNQQLYTIIDVTDPALREKLAESCDHQPMIAKAKMVLVFCADCKKWYDAYRAVGCEPRDPGVGDLMLAVGDAMIAAQNAVTAAESLGIGSCYVGDVMENFETQRDLLGLPEYVFPAGMVIFGFPTEQQQRREKPARVDLKFVVHENAYRALSDAELEEMWSPRSGAQGYRAWMKAFCDRKYNSDFSREMTRSVAAAMGQFRGGKRE